MMTKDFIFQVSDRNSLFNFDLNDQPSFNLFDPYWNFGTSVNKYKIAKSTAQYKKILFNKRQDSEVCRVQNSFMNLCFRGLAYYYTKMNVDFTLEKAMIHLTGNTARELAETLTEIEDMSYLMVKLLRFNIEEYTKKKLKDTKDGVLVIFERICLAQLSYGKIPAMLPMYIVELKPEDSDSD